MGLVHRAQVGADGNLHHFAEAQLLQGSPQLGGGVEGGELVDKGGGHQGIDPVAAVEALDQLIDLALVGDGAEGAVDQALAAGDAAGIVDLSAAQGIRVDGAHAAGRSAGALGLDDGVVGADVHAAAALDALLLVNGGAARLPGDGALGAHFHTGVGKAALAQVRDLHHLFGAAVAGELDDVDQGGIVVLVRNVGVLQARHHAVVLVHPAGGQADGQAHALFDDGPLQEDVLAQLAFFAGDDLIGDGAHHVVGLLALDVGVGHPGDFGEYRPPDLDDGGINASEAHSKTLLCFCRKPGVRGPWARRRFCRRGGAENPSARRHSYKVILSHFTRLEKGRRQKSVKKITKNFSRFSAPSPGTGR